MVEYLLVEAFYNKEIKLSEESLKQLYKYKAVALFASVQFIKLDTVEKQLKDLGIEILTAHGKRTSGKYQLLGCDCFADSFTDKDIFNKAEAVLYIGDGLFHPKALLLAQVKTKNPKDVLLFDPIAGSIKTITQEDIKKQIARYKGNLLKYLHANNIGILVSTKTGQQYLKNAIRLKEQMKDKNTFIFVDDTFDLNNIENYPFIEAWVNTGCPRIGFDDVVHLNKPLVNINDALNTEEALVKYSM